IHGADGYELLRNGGGGKHLAVEPRFPTRGAVGFVHGEDVTGARADDHESRASSGAAGEGSLALGAPQDMSAVQIEGGDLTTTSRGKDPVALDSGSQAQTQDLAALVG